MSKPVILLSSSINQDKNGKKEYAVNSLYTSALMSVGAVGVAFCGLYDKSFINKFDGLLLTGGGDVDPAYFGEQIRFPTLHLNAERDTYEMKLIEEFYKANKPIFGICRGMQLINVYFGGTLFQDIENGLGLYHREKRHRVITSSNSILRKSYGRHILTNSFHHQAIKTVANEFSVSAICDDDGIIEAIEHHELNIFGVQWHPERMMYNICMDTKEDMTALFENFIDRCKFR